MLRGWNLADSPTEAAHKGPDVIMTPHAIQVIEVPAGEIDRLFEPGAQLHGFSRTRLTPSEISSERAQALRDALGHDRDVALGVLPDGRLVALDYLVSGPYRLAIEEKPPKARGAEPC